MLAEIYLMQGKEDKAIILLEEVSRENENLSALIEQNIGKIYTDSGNFDKAIEVYRRLADKLYGKSKTIILMQLGDVLNKAGKYEEAGQVFEELTTLAPNDTINYYIAGKFYEYTKNYEKAEKMYLGALNINPTYAQTLKRLAVVYLPHAQLLTASVGIAHLGRYVVDEAALERAVQNLLFVVAERLGTLVLKLANDACTHIHNLLVLIAHALILGTLLNVSARLLVEERQKQVGGLFIAKNLQLVRVLDVHDLIANVIGSLHQIDQRVTGVA